VAVALAVWATGGGGGGGGGGGLLALPAAGGATSGSCRRRVEINNGDGSRGAGVLGGAQKGAADTARSLQISWRRLHIDEGPRWHMTPNGTAELPQCSTFSQSSEAR